MIQSRSGDEPSALSNHRSYGHGFSSSVAEPSHLHSPHPFASEITELMAFAPVKQPPVWATANQDDSTTYSGLTSLAQDVEAMSATEAWKLALRASWKDAKMHFCIRLARLIDSIVWPNNAHAVSLPSPRRPGEAA